MKKIFVAVAFSVPVTVAHAFDSISAEAGHGTRGVDMWRLGLTILIGLMLLTFLVWLLVPR